jgi:MinD superfamily P-loop ATPase
MKEIVILSGKGGAGKTSIATSFAALAKEKILLADYDVDAADMHILLQAKHQKEEKFYSGFEAIINQEKCIQCGNCKILCQFDAIDEKDNHFFINPIDCEGCGYCEMVCPEKAISMKEAEVGNFYISKTRFNNHLFHAKLNIGADNSGKLVSYVKEQAKKYAEEEEINCLLSDGPPGVGCPAISSITGANYVVIVTETSLSGFSDMKRLHELINNFKIPSGCIINKANLNIKVKEEMLAYLEKNKISLLGEIPYNKSFPESIRQLKTINEYDKNMAVLIEKIWGKINTFNN